MSSAGSSFGSVVDICKILRIFARSAIFSREELLISQEFILLNGTAKRKVPDISLKKKKIVEFF